MNAHPAYADSHSHTFDEPRPVRFASLSRRFVAYLIDAIPIFIVIGTFYFFVMGFDQVWEKHHQDRKNLVTKQAYMSQKGQIRLVTTAMLFLYGAIMECSPWQGTIGKRLLGLKVVDYNGNRLTFNQSLNRNLSRPLSALVFGMGYFSAWRSPTKQTWHDKMAGAVIIQG